MQSRFATTPPSKTLLFERHSVSLSSAAHRCNSHQPGQDAVRPVHNNDLSVQAAKVELLKNTKRLKNAFAAQRTVSVRNKRVQGLQTLHSGIRPSLKAVHGIGQSISKAQEHAAAGLQLPSSRIAGAVLKEVQEHVPEFKELQHRIQEKAKRSWSSYERALEEQPMRTKALTSCVGLTVADLIAQAAEGSGWDVLRTARLSSFGLLWHGVSAHMWYLFLDKHVMPDNASSTKAIVSKMVLDQAIWAPLNTALFYAYLALADGRLSSLPDTLQAKLLPTILAGYALWPVAHLINFKYIPSSQRLLYINVINLFWTVYLSGMANSSVTIDPVQIQVQKFGLAIPVSHSPAVPPPAAVPAPPPPRVVQV